MPTYRVTDPSSGRRLRLTGESPPTEQELESIFASQQTPTATSPISTRPSAMAELIKDPSTLSRFAKHPLGTTLRTLAGASELYQGVPASAALDMQAGRPQDVIPNFLKVVTGRRPAQYGDVYQGAGVPAPLAAAGGLATDLAFAPGGAQAMAEAPRAIKSVMMGGTRLLGKALSSPVEFLKGSPKLVNQAKQAAHTLIQSFRQGGIAHEPFFTRLGQVSEEAWAPMKQLAASVEQPTTVDEIIQEVAKIHVDDPVRAKEVATIVRGTAGKQQVFANGPELEQFSSQLGKRTPLGVLKGKLPPRQAQLFQSDARTAVSNILERKAPESFQGFAAQAKQQWSSYKTIQQKLYDILSPGTPKEAETKAGVDFFQRAASGELTLTEQDFLTQILPEKFPELMTGVKTVTDQMGKALGRSRAGAVTRDISKSHVGVGGGAALIGYLLGRRH